MKRPSTRARDPRAAEDLLAEVLSSSRWNGAVAARLRMGGVWGVRFPATVRAGFHLVTRGPVWLRVDGHAPLRLATGDLAVLPHGTGHTLGAASSGEAPTLRDLLARPGARQEHGIISDGRSVADADIICGVYRFARPALHPVLAALPEVVVCSSTNPTLAHTAALLASELAGAPPHGGRAVTQRLADVLFVLAVRDHIDRVGESGGVSWLGAMNDPDFARALLALHRDPGRAWTTRSLARASGLSSTSLKRRFARELGEGFKAYLARLRIDRAKSLLRGTRRPLGEIAAEVGYTSEFAFSRAFSRAVGLPPGRFRRGGER